MCTVHMLNATDNAGFTGHSRIVGPHSAICFMLPLSRKNLDVAPTFLEGMWTPGRHGDKGVEKTT
jgi:hypothetical protein